MRRAALLLLVACGNPTFDPPATPAHDKREEGALHAARAESPFSCGAAGNSRNAADCPTTRPEDGLLPCDASGCHGGYAFEKSSADYVRALSGGEGPSCFTCHDAEWEKRRR